MMYGQMYGQKIINRQKTCNHEGNNVRFLLPQSGTKDAKKLTTIPHTEALRHKVKVT